MAPEASTSSHESEYFMSELFAAAGKRCRAFVMSGQAMFGFLRGLDGRAAYRLYGMPADTKLLGVTIIQDRPGDIAFLLESKEWDLVKPDAEEIPEATFEMLTALMPHRLEKPKPMLEKIEGGKRG
jgi:hypothetical protein